MTTRSEKTYRCAIYTRKSTEHGLELKFNSLDAQREACEAYIKSQAHEGWRILPQRYDDPAYSGGNLDRPALQQLLKDIDAGQIDVIVVYKIDRLTRSLADFAKLVEKFDKRQISFVAITQQFNTTTSMGRLTLNVLLSFAQFERELSSERVRDKIAASRRKGKWTGGSVPLGYDVVDKKLVVNEGEAKTVRHIYLIYLELKTLRQVMIDVRNKGIKTKQRSGRAGRKGGGIPFRHGTLAYLLKNRTYIGESGHGGKWYPGEHEAIVDRSVFDDVQNLLKTNSVTRRNQRCQSQSLLSGLLFDERGNRMGASYTTKRGARYRFYINNSLLAGGAKEPRTITRVSAPEVESKVLAALRSRFAAVPSNLADRNMLDEKVERIELSQTMIHIKLKKDSAGGDANESQPIDISWAPPIDGLRARIEGSIDNPSNEIDFEVMQSLAQAQLWIRALRNDRYRSVEKLAESVKLHPKVVRKKLRLAFLAPDITDAILNGQLRQPSSLGNLYKTTSLSWDEQRRRLNALDR